MYSHTPLRIIIAKLKELADDTRGISAIVLTLLAIPIFGAIGLSIDLARAYVLKSQLSTALDAAGLAAGRVVFSEEAKVKADAQMFFDANMPAGYMDANVSNLDISWDTSRENIELKVHADFKTTFMNVLGKDKMTVGARTVINRVNRGLELVMVLDNTGSMARDADNNSYNQGDSNMRIVALKEAAHDLVDILYGDKETQKNLWVSIVPYVTQVNVGYENIGFLKTSHRNNIITGSGGGRSKYYDDTEYRKSLGFDVNGDLANDTNYGWKGCVEMRDHLDGGTIDLTDNPPNSDFVPYLYYNGHHNFSSSYRDEDNRWIGNNADTIYHVDADDVTNWRSFYNSVGRGPNAGCPSAILPLTKEKTTIKAKIDELRPWFSGGTMGNVGMVWGWRAVSPRWRGLWHGMDPTLPKDYDEPLIDKAVIMMTDGENTIFSHGGHSSYFDYNSYSRQEKSNYSITGGSGSWDAYTNSDGRLRYTSSSYYRGRVDSKFSQVCSAMKAKGIIVYTIKFKDGNENLYRNCATSPNHFFNSPTKEALKEAFRTIGQELSNLRIKE